MDVDVDRSFDSLWDLSWFFTSQGPSLLVRQELPVPVAALFFASVSIQTQEFRDIFNLGLFCGILFQRS